MGERLCPNCTHGIHILKPPVCPICGTMQKTEQICAKCSSNPPLYTALRSWGVYGGYLQEAIHHLKYKRDVALGDRLASLMLGSFNEAQWKIDMVIPVPAGKSRKGERGYNQAALLARPIALYHGLSYRPLGLRKNRDIRSQVGLSHKERLQNVDGAFVANSAIVEGCSILVIDDVTTSGATLNACAKALKAAGTKAAYCLTLARAV